MWVLHRKYNGCFTFHGQKKGLFHVSVMQSKRLLVVPCSTKILRYFDIISSDFCPCKIKKNCIINKTKHGNFTGNKRGYPPFMKIPLTALKSEIDLPFILLRRRFWACISVAFFCRTWCSQFLAVVPTILWFRVCAFTCSLLLTPSTRNWTFWKLCPLRITAIDCENDTR